MYGALSGFPPAFPTSEIQSPSPWVQLQYILDSTWLYSTRRLSSLFCSSNDFKQTPLHSSPSAVSGRLTRLESPGYPPYTASHLRCKHTARSGRYQECFSPNPHSNSDSCDRLVLALHNHFLDSIGRSGINCRTDLGPGHLSNTDSGAWRSPPSLPNFFSNIPSGSPAQRSVASLL